MTTSNQNKDNLNNQILIKIEQLEKRLSRIEQYFDIDEEEKVPVKSSDVNSEESVESKVGEYGLSWLGNIVLTFGIIFLTQYFNSLGFKFVSSVLGFATSLGVFVIAYFINKNNKNLAGLFRITSYFLMYYFILRLHFFIATPLITNKICVVVMLLIFNGYLYYTYYKSNIKLVGSIALILLLFTGLVSDFALLNFSLCVFAALVSLYFFKKEINYKQLVFSQIVIYGAMFIWIIGNPIAGNSLHFMTTSKYVLVFLIAVAGIYSSIALIPNTKNELRNESITGSILFNGLLFTLLLVIYVVSLFETHFIWIFLSLFVVCLGFSAWLKIKTEWKNIPALFALYSFMAFSVAVYSYYKFPWAILLLAIESLLVVSVALWFRTKIIIVMNLLLFIVLLIINLFISVSVNQIYFVFPIIAIFSARIINWQKLRLDIKTDLIRNTYLIIAFFMFMYSFYKAVPSQFVTISWIVVAVVYFLLSLLLKNVKYRYMAIATFISTVLYLFIIDLSKIDLVYRVLTFMILSVILIVVSIYYSRKRRRNEND